MRTSFLFTLLVFLFACNFQSMKTTGEVITTETLSFNNEWKFRKDMEDWTFIDLPHTSKLEPLIVNNQWQGKSSYIKTFEVEENRHGKTIIHFEGVMHEATVFINELKVKEHIGGYLPFSVDLTDHLQSGQNTIRVEVLNSDNPIIPPGKPLETLDFNYYGGIYRDAWLIRKNEIYITDPFIENTKEAGWLIHFDEVTESVANGTLSVQLRNETIKLSNIEVKTKITSQGSSFEFSQKLALESKATPLLTIPIEIKEPQLWSTTKPTLYDISITLESGGQILDKIEDKIGIRDIQLNDDGFLLNGEKMFVRGTNRHQEYPYVGYAISDNANYRDALKIKNAGFDFVRLSHYPQDESFLDACDELGILVMDAIPGWQFFEEGAFAENSYQDIKDMVRRDRNHPSVVFWEVSLNESAMTDEYMEKANQILKEELPFKDTYSAGWIDHSSYDLFIPARQHAKPPYYWNNYKDGSRKIFIGEYGDWEYYAHNAGFNQTAFADLSEDARNSRQLRAHGEQRLIQQALNFQEGANSNRKGTGTIGHANWLMFDYNRGYADDLEASGISDIFRISKFAYYFYRSQRPASEMIAHPRVEDGPMLKIASYWNEQSSTDLTIYSNCDEVELFLNDRMIGKKRPEINQMSDNLLEPPFKFDLKEFKPGKLLAKGYIKGQEVIADSVFTPGVPQALELSVDYGSNYSREEEDVIFLYAKVIDANGVVVPNDSSQVTFQLNSPGELIGTNPVKAEAGIATILYKGDPEKLKLEAKSKQLKNGIYE